MNRLLRTPVKHLSHLRLLAAALLLLLGPLAPAQTPAPSTTPGARTDREVIAVVDGIPLTQLQWDRLAAPYFAEVEARAGRKLSEEEKAMLRKNVMSELVRERLWVADAKRRGFTATEAEQDARLQKNDFFKTNGKFDPEKFRRFKFSPESNYREIVEQVKNAVLLDKYIAWMRTRYGVPERELRKEFEERTAQASIRFLWLGPDQVSLEPQATAAQIRSYYETHPEEFQTSEEARLTYVRIPVEANAAMPDTLRAAAEKVARTKATMLLSALRSGKQPEPLARSFGGLKDTGVFRVGEPVRGLGRSDALEEAVRAAKLREWLPEPVRIGPNFIVARLDEHRMPATRPLREVSALAKHHADAALREAQVDSVAQMDYLQRPERYRVPLLRAAVVSRATDSFVDSKPVSDKDVARTLERLRKSQGVPDTARAWADSIVKTLPDLVRKERQLDLAFKTMEEAAGKLRRGDRPEEVARRFSATQYEASIYKGQPPSEPLLLEGSLLDSLYNTRPGTVAGPRVLRDSVFVARVLEVNDRFQPPYAAVRQMAHSEVEVKRRGDMERDAHAYFDAHRDRFLTPQRWALDFVQFSKMKPDSAPVPEDSIRAYYEGHSLEFTVPAKARVRHILITVPSGSPADKNAGRRKAEAILKRVKAGEDFAALAREFSGDRGSAAKGGDLGEVTRGEVVKEFGNAVFAMKPGDVSSVVETRFGYHIIRLESLTPQRLRSLDESRSEIRGVLGEDLSDSLASRAAAAFAEKASKPGATFEEVAKAGGATVASATVGRAEPIPGIGEVPGLESAIGTLPPGGVSRPIPIAKGYIVARVRRSIPPERASFADAKDEAIRAMQGERRRAVADSVDNVLQRELREGKNLETLALPYGGLRISRYFPRRGPVPELARDTLLARDSTLYNEIFRSRPGTVLRPRPGAIGTLYAVVDSVKVLDRKQYAEHRKALADELFEQRTAAWTERLRARAKIQIYRKDLDL